MADTNKLVWIQVYENDKLTKVRGLRVGVWAMRPERPATRPYHESKLSGPGHTTTRWEFWHESSGLRCDRGGGPKDVVLKFLTSTAAYVAGMKMSKTTSRPEKEKIFYDLMARWGEFYCDTEKAESDALPTSTTAEINRVRNMLLDKAEYPLTPEHAQLLANALGDRDGDDVRQVLLAYAAEATRIKKARKAHAERWDHRKW